MIPSDHNTQQTNCSYCGASLKSYWHRLTPGLVSVLIKAIVFVHAHGNKFHYRDLNLNYSEASNLQKLRFHALIAHWDKENLKSGYWLITGRGGQFLRGEIAVPAAVRAFRNEVQKHSTELVHINEFRGKVPCFESSFAARIERPEPARVPAGVLF
jgi:hypothetical protein